MQLSTFILELPVFPAIPGSLEILLVGFLLVIFLALIFFHKQSCMSFNNNIISLHTLKYDCIYIYIYIYFSNVKKFIHFDTMEIFLVIDESKKT